MNKPLCLVVEDSRVIRRVTIELLQNLGFRAEGAENGRDAVEYCKNTVPDLVLLDWNMPEMDGFSCLQILRASPLAPRPVIVMCTTEKDLEKIRRAVAAGADEYIMKPYDLDILRDKLIQLGLLAGAQ